MPHLQGEVYRYLPNEKRGPTLDAEYGHRALIVSSNEYNQSNHLLIILFTSQKQEQKQLPSWVSFPPSAEFGLTKNCVAQGESLTRCPPRYLGERLGRINDDKLGEVIEAIGYAMALRVS